MLGLAVGRPTSFSEWDVFHIPTPPAHQLTPFSPDVELRQLLFMVEQGISHKASAIETSWRQEMNPLLVMSWWSRSHGSVGGHT